MNEKIQARTIFIRLLPYLACVVPLAVYQALYANGYFPITEGWFSEYAHLVRSGLVPYRDFSLLLPPLYTLQLAGFQALFGESYFALHIFGILVTCAIAVALLDLLKNFFNPWVCAFAAAIGTVYYESGVAFLGYDFTQFLTLYVLIGAVLLVRSIKQPEESRRSLWLCAGSGAFLALAFLTKQSNAALATLALGLGGAAVALALYRLRVAFERIGAFIGGFSVPLAATVLWLLASGAFRPFISDVFVHAASAKGGVKVAIFTWVWYFFHDPTLPATLIAMAGALIAVVLSMILIAVVIEAFIAAQNRRPLDKSWLRAALRRAVGINRGSGDVAALVAAVVGLAALCALAVFRSQGICETCEALTGWGKAVVAFQYAWSVDFYLVGCAIALGLLLRARTGRAARFLLLCALGIGLTFGNGTSAGLSEISMFVGIAMLFGFLMNNWRQYLFPAFVPIAVALSFCIVFIDKKFEVPYKWWSVITPAVQTTNCAPSTGILAGLCLPPDNYSKIEIVEKAIEANSSLGDPIYVYPHMPVFYLLTGRKPLDNAVVSWFDFMSRGEALAVARDLRAHTPPVIVMAEIPEYVIADHEKAFNGGKPLAQRSILAAVGELKKSGAIKLIARVKDLDATDIDVYVRSRSR